MHLPQGDGLTVVAFCWAPLFTAPIGWIGIPPGPGRLAFERCLWGYLVIAVAVTLLAVTQAVPHEAVPAAAVYGCAAYGTSTFISIRARKGLVAIPAKILVGLGGGFAVLMTLLTVVVVQPPAKVSGVGDSGEIGDRGASVSGGGTDADTRYPRVIATVQLARPEKKRTAKPPGTPKHQRSSNDASYGGGRSAGNGQGTSVAGRAPAPSIITNPDWVTKPTGEQLADLYPEQAQRLERSGVVSMDCGVSANGDVKDCSILSEDPPGFEFGSASLKAAKRFKMRPRTVDGRPVEGARAPITIRWSLDG